MDTHPNEMGDIGPALNLLLLAHAGYARSDPAFSRAMRDVAEKALIREINVYVEWRAKNPTSAHQVQPGFVGANTPTKPRNV